MKIHKTYKRQAAGILISALVLSTLQVQAQSQVVERKDTIVSTIVDENGLPITNAIIHGREGAVTVAVDIKGQAKIVVPINSELLIEAQGYEPSIVTTSDASNVVLKKAPFLQGVMDWINIPFGKIQKSDVVNNITTLNASDFENDNVNSLEEALIARIPGLVGTLNNQGMGDMAVFIDGLKRPLNSISLPEVEQITVLKDINSSTLYGVQAHNGVILITTKRGEPLKRRMNILVEQGVGLPISKPRYLNSADYMTLYNEARRNDGLTELYSTEEIENYRSGNKYRYPDVDYYSDEFLKNHESGTRINAEFSGGNKRTRYYTNMGWLRNGSLYNKGEGKNAGYNRFNVRGNVDFYITDFIKSHLDVAALFDINRGLNGDFWNYGATYHPNYYSPLLPIDLVEDQTLIDAAELIDGKYILGGTSQYQNNVYGDLFMSGYTQNTQRTAQFNGGIDIDINKWVKGLSASANLSFDFYNSFMEQVKNTYAVYQPTWNDQDQIVSLTKIGQDVTDGRKQITSGDFYRSINANIAVDYKRSFGLHNVAGTFFGYYNHFSQNTIRMADKITHAGLRVMYNFNQKYFVDFSSALSSSPKLGGSNKVGYSPSLGVAWVISNEDFWNKESFINYLKLKASGGILNTDLNFGFNLYKESFNSGTNFTWNDNSGYVGSATNVAQSQNSHLGFEQKKNLNFGLEAYMFDKSLAVNANYFNTLYSGQIIRRGNYYSSLLGSFYPYENYGENSYQGVELGLNWNKKINKVWMNIGMVMTYATSEVIKRDEAYNHPYLYRTGKPTDAAFGLESLGLYKDQTQVDAAPTSRFGTIQPGDIMYKDQNNDGQIDDNDQVKIGNTTPRLSYGLTINLRYENFSLFVLGQGAAKYNNFHNTSYDWVDGDKKYSEVVWNRWTPETAETATYPRLSSQANNNNFRQSTYWMYDASYFSLRRVQLGYSLPKSLMAGTFIKGAEFFLRGSDLIMLCKNAKRRQMNITGEPQYRNFALGMKMSF